MMQISRIIHFFPSVKLENPGSDNLAKSGNEEGRANNPFMMNVKFRGILKYRVESV